MTKNKRKMVKKTKKQEKPAEQKIPYFLVNIPQNHGERLEQMIRLTERHDSDTMKAQAIRLKAELEQWRKDNPMI